LLHVIIILMYRTTESFYWRKGLGFGDINAEHVMPFARNSGIRYFSRNSTLNFYQEFRIYLSSIDKNEKLSKNVNKIL